MALALSCTGFPSFGQGAHSGISLSTVVIDPGHGGKDPGCTSPSGKTLEKTIVLDIGKRLKSKINAGFPGVKVIMTRSDDTFISLQERANIANRNNADLFISIHLNSVEGKRSGPNGYSVHTLGQYTSKKKDLYAGNMDVVSRENSVIKLEDDYTTHYEGFDPSDPESYIFMNLMQNAFLEQSLKFAQYADEELRGGAIANSRGISQDPLLVLWKTAMPSVLVECGFMSNPTDRGAMITEAGRDRVASDLYDAFCRFKKEYDGSVAIAAGGAAAPEEKAEAKTDEHDGTPKGSEEAYKVSESATKYYGTQVIVSSKILNQKDPFFDGQEFRKVKAGKVYKYIVGFSTDIKEARQKFLSLRKKFPDSFLVVVEDEKVSALK